MSFKLETQSPRLNSGLAQVSCHFHGSRVAQWKRAGPITQRSVDRNHALLDSFISDLFDIIKLIQNVTYYINQSTQITWIYYTLSTWFFNAYLYPIISCFRLVSSASEGHRGSNFSQRSFEIHGYMCDMLAIPKLKKYFATSFKRTTYTRMSLLYIMYCMIWWNRSF